MQNLIDSINQLKNSEISEVIDNRIKEFANIGENSIEDIFIECTRPISMAVES